MYKFFAISLTLLVQVAAFSQTSQLKGKVSDKTEAVQGATVSLLNQSDSSLVATTLTTAAGYFEWPQLQAARYIVTVTSTGYQQYVSFITLRQDSTYNLEIPMVKQGKDLSVVTIVARASPVIQKGDTSQFSASQYKVNPDASTEDLIKKMPGITVARDGTVTAQGEQVRKVTLDGKDFFGDDATAALRNLPSEIVDKIQVFDRLSDQAQLTGVDDGNSQKSINIVTKSGVKNGQFGRAYAGYGTDDRYSAGGNVSFFKDNRRLSVVGNFNNINQQNFSSQDLLGVTSSGGGRGGGRRGGGGGEFNVGQSNGISTTNAVGLNFSNQYGPKATVTGSYFYNNSKVNNASQVNTSFIQNPRFIDEVGNSQTNNTNHRLNLRLEYKLDSANTIFFIPSMSFQKNNSVTTNDYKSYYDTNDSIQNSFTRNVSDKDGFNIRNSLLFRHAFPKRGRSLSLGVNTTHTRNDGQVTSDGVYRFFNNGSVIDSIDNILYDNASNGKTLGANINYTEPLGKKGFLQFEYQPSVQNNTSNQQALNYDGNKYSRFDTTRSNQFDNTVTTQNGGINYRLVVSRDEMFMVGVNYQHSTLESERIFPSATTVNQSFSNVLPNLMWRKKLSSTGNMRLFYRASTNFPSINQLQDVVNPSNNSLNVSVGNPQLKQSYTHLLAGRYTYTNSKTSKSFFANLFLQTASNYITNALYIPRADSVIQQKYVVSRGAQLTKPVNVQGYNNLRTFFTYSMPFKGIKSIINLNAGFAYSRLPGVVNSTVSITNNYVYNAGIVLASNISEFVDYSLSYSTNYNDAVNVTSRLDTRYVNQAIGAQLKLLNKKGWFIHNDVSYQKNSGLAAGLNQVFTLWNAAVGKKFLKNNAGELKLSVFDLLSQNQSVVRTVTNLYVEDARNEVLQQYFMLTMTYNLKNFGKASPAKRDEGERGGGMYRGGF